MVRSSEAWERWLTWRRANHHFTRADLEQTFERSAARFPWKSLMKKVGTPRSRPGSQAVAGLAGSSRPTSGPLYYEAVNCNNTRGTADEVARLPLLPTRAVPTSIDEEALRRVSQATLIPACSGRQSWTRVRDLLSETALVYGQAQALPANTWPAVAWAALQLEAAGSFKIIGDEAFKRLRLAGSDDTQMASKLLSSDSIPTLVSSRSCKLSAADSRARTIRELDAHAYASLQDVPVARSTGIRAALCTFSAEC